ncbi:MAG: NAD(P)H-dependent oxidoreductase [Pirellulales bacterium]
MIIVDTALERREAEGNPIRVGIVGAGYMGRGIAQQLLTPITGMRLVAVSNRNVELAERAFREGGIDNPRTCTTLEQLERSIDRGEPAVCGDAGLLCQAPGIDVLIETTGHIEFASGVALAAIAAGKHLVLVNAELDATIGPVLKEYARRAGVVLTNVDGDEPGVAMNLLRFVRTIGYQPVMAGNIKGFINRHRNPDTQREFAAKNNQQPAMITSFADGTKLSMEAAILANATGFGVGQRGMFGHACGHVKDVLQHFQADDLLASGGLVDYVLGAEPGTGAFVVGYNENPIKQQYMRYFKMGDGPLYCFYTPYHLPHLQVAVTVARATLFHDAAVTPLGPPRCDVVAVAKRGLKAGETLDGIGGFTCYGTIDNADTARQENLLPMGLSEGCRVVRDVPQDRALCRDDVELPPDRVSDRLRTEQDTMFAESPAAAAAVGM